MRIPYKIQQVERVLSQAKIGLNWRFKCNYCDKDYASPSGRRRHEVNVHLQDNQVLVLDDSTDEYSSDEHEGDTAKLREHPKDLTTSYSLEMESNASVNSQGDSKNVRYDQKSWEMGNPQRIPKLRVLL